MVNYLGELVVVPNYGDGDKRCFGSEENSLADLAGRVTSLPSAVKDYADQTTATMKEWLGNLVLAGLDQPEENEDFGHLESASPIDMFRIIRGQLDLIEGCNDPDLLAAVLQGCAAGLESYIDLAKEKVQEREAVNQLACGCNDASHMMVSSKLQAHMRAIRTTPSRAFFDCKTTFARSRRSCYPI